MKLSTVRDQEVIDIQKYLENSSEYRRKVLLNHFDLEFTSPGSEGVRQQTGITDELYRSHSIH